MINRLVISPLFRFLPNKSVCNKDMFYSHFRAAPGKGRFEFETSITNLFSAIMGTMVMTGDIVLPLQVIMTFARIFS